MGRIIPIFCEEVIPDDKWSVATALKLELAPLRAPLMHNIDVYVYYFFVPNNLLSSAWDTWISQGEPADSPNIPFPARFSLLDDDAASGLPANRLSILAGPSSLLDYLGFSNEYARLGQSMPVSDTGYMSYSILPALAYHAVWLNHFRNENLLPLPTSWGNPGGYNPLYDKTTNVNLSDWRSWNFFYRNNVVAPLGTYLQRADEDVLVGDARLLPNANLRRANFMHDYFTASLPFTQRGPQVKVSLGGTAPVIFDNPDNNSQLLVTNSGDKPTGIAPSGSDLSIFDSDGSDDNAVLAKQPVSSSSSSLNIDPNGTLVANLQESTGLSIIDLRRLSKLQQWLEKNAIGGNNPGENIYNHFGVRPSNISLDRTQFLGGGRIPVVIGNVLQTSQTTDTSPQASPSGYARSQGFAGFRSKKFRDYGWILGVVYVMPRSKYMQGTRRYWDRSSRFDYFWMEFERIGEQPVYNYEIFDTGLQGENLEEFGYNPRYADYKYIPSSVHGDFKTSLSFWHAARIFSSRPKLNNTFMHLGKDIERIYSVDESVSTQQLWFWLRHQVKVRRPMLKNPISILG